MQQKSMTSWAWVLLLTLSLLWGGSFFFIELALRNASLVAIVFGRVSLAAIALTSVVYLTGKSMPLSLAMWRDFWVMGALNNLIPFSLIVWGQTQISSSLAAILNATTPIFAVLLAHVLTHDERLTPNRLAGVGLGVCGVAVLIGFDALQGLSLTNLGQLAVLGAAVSYAIAGLYGRRFRQIPTTVAAAGMLIGTATLMLPIIWVDRSWMMRPSLTSGLAVLGLALLSTAIAYLLYFQILAIAGATNLLLVTFLIPISAMVLGVCVLGEQIHSAEILGTGLILASLATIDGRIFKPITSRTQNR